MQVLSVRGRTSSQSQVRTSFRREAETDLTDTAFQGRANLKPASPPARAPNEGSDRDPQPPTPSAPTGTKPRRFVVVRRP